MKPLQFHDLHPPLADLHGELIAGLSLDPKRVEPKFFYDRRGSELFERITELPEYYLTRTELALYREHGAEMAAELGESCFLVELGAGSSRKIRLLLDALRPSAYMAMDISRDFLLHSSEELAREYPELEVHAACADYSQGFTLPHGPEANRRAAFFPGSSIGNFEPAAAERLLETVADSLGEGAGLLIGVDLKKSADTLTAAYNDAAGVTAQFNLNLLERANRELEADFDLEAFRHRAWYNDREGRVEMHLEATREQAVTIGERTIPFRAGETIHTENSYKYDCDQFLELAASAGFSHRSTWRDDAGLFSVHCLRVA